MTMRGSCECNNIKIAWQIVDCSLVPRACQCEYCLSKSAAYVSKAGTKFEAVIQNKNLYKIIQHGSNCAKFYECANCSQVVFVTAEIEGEIYGALNANCLHNKLGFSPSIQTNVSAQSADQKRERWRQNWCCPVLIID